MGTKSKGRDRQSLAKTAAEITKKKAVPEENYRGVSEARPGEGMEVNNSKQSELNNIRGNTCLKVSSIVRDPQRTETRREARRKANKSMWRKKVGTNGKVARSMQS